MKLNDSICKCLFNIKHKGVTFRSYYAYNNTHFIKIDRDITQLNTYLR